MEISNGFLRSQYGNWYPLNKIKQFMTDESGSVNVVLDEKEVYVISIYDDEVQAQSELDKLMRLKWN